MTNPPTSGPGEYPDRMSPQRKAWIALFLWPVVITAAGVLWYLSFMDQLPEQVATHWSRRGPDGFTARETIPWFGLYGLAMTWFTSAVVLAIGGENGSHRRWAVGLAGGMATFMAGVIALTAYDQRGLSHGSLARDAEWPIIVAMLASLALGALAALTVPGNVPGQTRASGRIPADAVRADLAVGERIAWTRVAAPGRWFALMLAFLILTMVITGVLTNLWIFTTLMTILVVGMLLAFSVFRVTIGGSGMIVRGGLGFPRWTLPLEDVVEAKVTDVDPFTEFGGWGYRMGLHGRTGFVVRKGAALEVERGDGTAWVVTVDEPEEGAALLNTLADRARP